MNDSWVPWEAIKTTQGIAGGSKSAIVAHVEQGGSKWLALRCGIVTASGAGAIVTSTGKASTAAARDGYLCELAGERLTGSTEGHFTNAAMERGTKLEPEARDWYSFATGRDVAEVGFVWGDDSRQYGCSPDGLCVDRGLEIKCPMRKAMIGALLDDKFQRTYRAQVQFCMWCTGLPMWDVCYYHDAPEIPNRIWTIERDPKMHDAFEAHIKPFISELHDAVRKIKETA